MTITFMGLNSVLDRTLFTNRGPIVKRPLPVLTGINLEIISETDISIPTGAFTSTYAGFRIQISGSAGFRNDGDFRIKSVLSSTRLRLENTSFDTSDVLLTTNKIVALANDLKNQFNRHRIQAGIHSTNDTINVVSAQIAVNLTSAILLLNDIRTKLAAHVIAVPIHSAPDLDDIPIAESADNLISAVRLANDLRSHFENHRTLNAIHLAADFVNKIIIPEASVIKNVFPGSLTGPFNWTISDPRVGLVADDPTDVDVLVNSNPASIDAVFGLLGAVVLTVKPGPLDDVKVNYNFLNNPPARLLRLNSPEFNLNQAGNIAYSGFPSHRYRARSYLIDPHNSPDFISAVVPKKVGWKYKAFERAYSAVLNDPTTLLLNVPNNRVTYPVLFTEVQEVTVRYDPTSLPQNASDPWTLEGVGSFSLAPGGSELTIIDNNPNPGTISRPPFFTHLFNFLAPSIVSVAFRAFITSWVLDGSFTGVGFGISDGNHVGLVGFIETNATGLSSAITRINDFKKAFNAHLIQFGVHNPNDPSDNEIIVDAHDLASLIILTNDIKTKFNAHLNKSGLDGVHQITDVTNIVFLPNAHDLDSAIQLVNTLTTNFNTHRIQTLVHFVNDTINMVSLVKQIGFLTNRGAPELELSWNAFSIDWTIQRTYRISRDPDGNVSIFLSGSPTASITALSSELPAISDLDGRFDALQQIFFGSIEKEATSTSKWNFIRANINPLDSNLIGDNKFVDMVGIPELALPPWITVGQGGFERLITGTVLLTDSTCSAPSANIALLGQSSGAYRGYLRIEPIITSNTTVAYDIIMQIDYYTFGVDNRAAGIYIDDDDFTIQLSFIQFSPSPATVTGTSTEPFALTGLDTLVLSISGGPSITVNFTAGANLATVISEINTAVGLLSFADNNLNHLRLTSSDLGAEANFSIISGSAMAKFGLSPGIYFGKDSNPEPRVSWFGENLPDQDTPHWDPAGTQAAQLLGRTLRLTDTSPTDFKVYTLSDPLVTNNVFNPSINWKLDIRLSVLSFAGAATIPAIPPFLNLGFIGALVSVDEGPTGKSIELQLAIDGSGNQYLNLVSFNSSTSALDVKGQFAFAWNDGKIHSFNIYTNKSINAIFVLADGTPLSPIIATPTPTYSGLNQGILGPSISFGSGSAPVTGSDLRVPRSVIDWHSVAIFKDSKVDDPTAGQRRFVGIYKGGDPATLSSYYLAQFDWSVPTQFRLVRDPQNAVSLFINNNPTPAISVSYDSLTLPLVSSSFLKNITDNRSAIAFGSFNPQEIVRSRWTEVRYSVGKITLTNRLIPPHQVLNQANVIVSPEHLSTDKPHGHFGFSVYSGGTPTDDFLSDPSVPAFTILGEGTPIVPATQNLDTRGGLKKTITPFDGILTIDFVNTPGFTSDYLNDIFNVVSADPPDNFIASVSALVSLVNSIKPIYNNHIVSAAHVAPDFVNTSLVPLSTNLITAISLVNELKLQFNGHLVEPGIHDPNDSLHTITLPNAFDLPSAIQLVDELRNEYEAHRMSDGYHIVVDSINTLGAPIAIDLRTTIGALDEIRVKFASHTKDPSFHSVPDFLDGNYDASVSGVSYALIQLDSITLTPTLVQNYPLSVNIGDYLTFLLGPNVGIDFPVSRINGNGTFNVAPPSPLVTTVVPQPIAKVPSAVVSSGTAKVSGTGLIILDSSIVINVGDVVQFTAGPNAGSRQSAIQFLSPTSALVGTPFVPDGVGSPFSIFNSIVGDLSVDLDTAFSLANLLKTYYDRHLTLLGIHPTPDTLNGISAPDVLNLTSLTSLTNAIHNAYNVHRIGHYIHVALDVINIITVSSVIDPLEQAMIVANEIKEKFNQHVIQVRVHIKDDVQDLIALPDAVGLPSLIILLNLEKIKFNTHRVASGVHVLNDAVNIVSTPDAIDLATALQLTVDLRSAYEAHRTQSGVHGSSVFIRLDPPSRVLYEGMKFFEFESGTPDLVAPFSDDETWHLDGFNFKQDQTLSWIGGVFPEQAQLIGNNFEPFPIIGGDTLILQVDNGGPITVTFQPGETNLILITARINATPGIPPTLALKFPFGFGFVLALISPTVGPPSAVRVIGGTAVIKLGLDVPQYTPWFIISDDPSNVSVSLIPGIPQYTNYQTIGAGTRTVYRNNSGLPDVISLGWEITLGIRINSVFSPTDVDSDIYVGVSGFAGPGFTVAIGFDRVNNLRFVKIQDLNANKTLYRIPFNWADGLFHVFTLRRDASTNTISLIIES